MLALGLAVVALALGGLSIDLWRVLSAHARLAAITEAAAVAGAGGIDLERLYDGAGETLVLSVPLATNRACAYLIEHLEIMDCPGPDATVTVRSDTIEVRTVGYASLSLGRLLLLAGGDPGIVEISAVATASPFRLAATP